MRIISGKHKGRKINAPKKLPVRPTTDMAKEGLFNILNNSYYFDDLKVLDLFAGTGSISYEFASRGTLNITSVDENANCIRFITQTSEQLELPIHAIKQDVFQYLKQTKEAFHIIFADPPYDFTDMQFLKIADLVFSNNSIKEDGFLIIEHSKHTDLSEHLAFKHSRNYGGSVFSFFALE